jgi:hypothetical protein
MMIVILPAFSFSRCADFGHPVYLPADSHIPAKLDVGSGDIRDDEFKLFYCL